MEKEPELVQEVERHWLEIVGLTSTHSSGSGTSLLKRGWTLFYPGFIPGERQRAGVANVLELTPVDERVVFLHFPIGKRVLIVVCTYAQFSVPTFFWSPWKSYWRVPLVGTPLSYWETSTLMWEIKVRPGRV